MLAWYVLGDKLSDFEVFAMIASFCGILLIAFSGKNPEGDAMKHDGSN